MWQRSVLLAIFVVFIPSSRLLVFASPQSRQEQPPAVVSHARAVNLSFVAGTVIVRSQGSAKWRLATLNMPIEEGMSIATATRSFAEVQFEEGSTVRIGELSRIDFNQMVLAPRNRSINHLRLVLGLATLHVMPEGHDEFTLTALSASILAKGSSEFRTDLRHERVRVEVFKGRVQVTDLGESEKLRNHQMLVRDVGLQSDFQITRRAPGDDWDKWVQQRDREASQAPGFDPWDGWVVVPPVYSDDGF